MGKFDYSLDLGADMEKLSVQQQSPQERNDEIKTEVVDEKPITPGFDKKLFFLLAILLILGFFYLTITDKLYFFDIQAGNELTSNLRESIKSRIFQNNPLISPQGLEQQAFQELSEIKKTSYFKEQLKERTMQLKDWHKDDSGQVYLYGLDSYYYYRMANQYALWGSFDNPLTFNKTNPYYSIYNYKDPLRFAPRGDDAYPTILSYFIYYFYKFLSWFSNASVMTAAFYLPVIFGLLSIVCFFFIAHKMFNNSIITFATALLFTLNQRFFIGTYAGNTDTQVLAFFFTLLVVLIFVHFIDFSNKVKSVLLFFLFFPVFVLFSKSWPPGWKYILVVLFGFIVVHSLLALFKGIIKKEVNYYYLLLLAVPFIFIKKIIEVINLALQRFNPKVIFPSGERNIGELASSSLSSIMDSLGGVVLSTIALLTIIYLIYKNLREPNKYEIFVISWFVPMLIAGMLARRFTYFIAPSFCLLIGFGIYYAYPYITKVIGLFALPVKKEYTHLIVGAVLSILILVVLSNDLLASVELFPEVNDAIAKTADYIKQNSSESSIIFTGMNRGYLWQALAMRGTILDGAMWNIVREYFLYNALTMESESLAKKLFYLMSTFQDLYHTSKINNTPVYDSFLNVYTEALKGTLKDPSINTRQIFFKELESYKRENPTTPESFVVIDKDTFYALSRYYSLAREDLRESMIREKEFSNKNFTKYNLTEKEKDYWLDRALNRREEVLKVSELYDCFGLQDGKLLCGMNFVVDLQNLDTTQNNLHPYGLILVKEGVRQERIFSDGVDNFVLFVFEGNKGYQSFMVDKRLKDTLTARLYSGEKVEGFEQVHAEHAPERILTYKILWA